MIQFFRMTDFDCKCGRFDCNAKEMDMETVMKLEGLRREFGGPMSITSAARCRFQNTAVGGSKNSQHLAGRAVDIKCPDGLYMLRLVTLAMKHGFTGIGVGKGFVHLDTRPRHPVMFGY
jgi:uncharacterized protein YcbK (DUF882 family)